MKINYFIGLLFAILCMQTDLNAQTTAVTEEGDTIFVYPNGTWSYEFEDFEDNKTMQDYLNLKLKIDTLNMDLSFDPEARKKLDTKIAQFEFRYNDRTWKRVPPSNYNEEAEFAFEHRENDIWAIIITEQAEVGLENILKISLRTLEENTGAVPKMRKTELIKVNGVDVLRGALDVELSGIEFVFDSYYYSDKRGTTQIVTWTGKAIWEKNEEEINNFLNGLIVMDEK